MSKLMIFDFLCEHCKTQFEDMVKPDEHQALCPDCHQTAMRIISPVRLDRSAIALTAGASPESIAHFDRIHQQKRKIEEKSYAEHGSYSSESGY